MNNIDFSKKYLKYKNKYTNAKSNTLQVGGVCTSSKYILLSCNEFNGLVDAIIELENEDLPGGSWHDGANKVKGFGEHSDKIRMIETEFTKVKGNNDESIISNFVKFCKANYEEFYNFIKETEIKETAIIDTYNDPVTYKRVKDNFTRKHTILESKNFYRGYINWKEYADKTPDIKMNAETIKRIRGGKVIFFAYFSFNEPNVTSIITQLLFLNSLNHYGVSEINIILPYFPVGTMERIVGEGEVPTAYSLAHMLNMIPSGASKNNLYIFDIHALCSRFFFHTNTRPVLISMMPDFLKEINKISIGNKGTSIIVFPDDGAKKRFEKLIDPSIKTVTCSKTRIGDKRKIRIDTGLEHFNGKDNKKINGVVNLFLIDDLVQTGGTLVETFKGLYEQLDEMCYNLNNINCYSIVTHSIFPDETKTEKFFNEKYVSSRNNKEIKLNIKLITTNSRPNRTSELKEKYGEKVILLNIANPIKDLFIEDCDTPYIAPYSIH
jgi:phosphoribosylpyrophosphate synthetase